MDELQQIWLPGGLREMLNHIEETRDSFNVSEAGTQDIIYGYNDNFEIIEKTLYSQDRYSVLYRYIVRNKSTSKHYKVLYSDGTSGMQDDGWVSNTYTFNEVFPEPETIIVYK